ncbi:hypothetical protein FPV67DRAFT_1443574 [Lyophyllum atratum]|nr:hypothetical protein FPV67DRAFT_1443574 [Lyophyllum atratum]
MDMGVWKYLLSRANPYLELMVLKQLHWVFEFRPLMGMSVSKFGRFSSGRSSEAHSVKILGAKMARSSMVAKTWVPLKEQDNLRVGRPEENTGSGLRGIQASVQKAEGWVALQTGHGDAWGMNANCCERRRCGPTAELVIAQGIKWTYAVVSRSVSDEYTENTAFIQQSIFAESETGDHGRAWHDEPEMKRLKLSHELINQIHEILCRWVVGLTVESGSQAWYTHMHELHAFHVEVDS